MTIHEGTLAGSGLRVAIVAARFNDFISERLLSGAITCLRLHGVDEGSVDVAWVPGSFEIPLVAQRFASAGRYDAVICLGTVIRGATPHFDLVAGQVAAGVSAVSRDTGIPVIFGVLTTDTIEQAIERAGTKAGNKGYDAATAAIQMANLMRQLPCPGDNSTT